MHNIQVFFSPLLNQSAKIFVWLGVSRLLNVIAVRGYGEAEFWLSGGKAILIFMLFFFTFVTMCGGNPQGDAYGFRYWSDPGSFAEYHTTGSLGRFEGFRMYTQKLDR